MKTKLGLLLVFLVTPILLACQQLEGVPQPKDMVADIEVKGRLSKLIDMDIKHVGKTIPYTYSHNKIANSPGYDWWVSKHFAIKSDLPEHKVKLYLELLELSYPHYVSLFGAEPANIEQQRIAVVYGSSRESTKSTMIDDGFTRGVHQHAGGETMYYNRAGYSFPSHRQQHQRYIVIHETMHAFHMALSGHSTWAPNWITEGLADAIASHVYYPSSNELAVMVFDRAPMNYLETGLKQYYAGGKPSIEQINNDPGLKRGLNFFIIHFLLAEPERAFYFSLFRDRLMQANPHSDATLPKANQLLQQTFPDWQQLEAEFAEFVAAVAPSFSIVQGPWEQDGNKYWIRSYNKRDHKNQIARLDIKLTSAQKVKLDFPQPHRSELIKHTPEFHSGLLIDLVPEHLNRGEVGLAIGLQQQTNKYSDKTPANKLKSQSPEQDSYLAIVLKQGRKLQLTGHHLAMPTHSYALTKALRDELQHSLQLGLSVEVDKQELHITLTSGKQQQRVSIAIPKALKLNSAQSAIALLSNDNYHQLTPYFAQQGSRADYFAKPDDKRWTQGSKLYRIFKVCEAFQLPCPSRLKTLIAEQQHITEGAANSQAHRLAVDALEQDVIQLIGNNDNALYVLSGIQSTLLVDKNGVSQRIYVPTQVQGNVNSHFSWLQQGKEIEQFAQLKRLKQGSQRLNIRNNANADMLAVHSQFEWQGQKFSIAQRLNAQPFDGVYLTTETAQTEQDIKLTVKLTGPYSGATKGRLTATLLPEIAQAQQQVKDVSIAPYQTKSWQFILPRPNNKVDAIEIVAQLEVDGEGIELSDFIYLTHE